MLVIGQCNWTVNTHACVSRHIMSARCCLAFCQVNCCFFMKKYDQCLVSFSNFVIVLINWYQDFVLSNSFLSVINKSDSRLALFCQILLITYMITDRIGLHWVPLWFNHYLKCLTLSGIIHYNPQLIQREGVESLTEQELQSASQARGMRAIGVPAARLRSQLQQVNFSEVVRYMYLQCIIVFIISWMIYSI